MSAANPIVKGIRTVVAGTVVLMIVGGFVAMTDLGPMLVGCNIKGNISKNNGQRIYHVPGQEHYAETQIHTLSGERWFCSEEEARAAGWRKARDPDETRRTWR
jgi:hypothetical protein